MEKTRESVAEEIAEAVTTWEKYDWKDSDLWESFQDDFEGYTEEDFRLVNSNDIRKLRNFIRRRGVWIEKSRLTIAKSLFNALQEEEPTQWTNADIQEYLSTEGAFDSYRINYRLKKTPIALSSGVVPPTIPPSVHPSIPPIIKPTTSVSNVDTNDLPQASLTPAPVNASHVLPSTIPFIPASTQPSGTRPAPAVEPIINPPTAINPSAAMTTTSTGHGRELPNLAKTYTDKAKHSGQSDSSTFKLANLWKNALNSLLKNFRMGSTGGRGSCQAMRWMRWMGWDTQDGMDETRVGVG